VYLQGCIFRSAHKNIVPKHGTDKAACIAGLFQDESNDTDLLPRGINEITIQIATAIEHKPSLRVEDIAADVLMRECVDKDELAANTPG